MLWVEVILSATSTRSAEHIVTKNCASKFIHCPMTASCLSNIRTSNSTCWGNRNRADQISTWPSRSRSRICTQQMFDAYSWHLCVQNIVLFHSNKYQYPQKYWSESNKSYTYKATISRLCSKTHPIAVVLLMYIQYKFQPSIFQPECYELGVVMFLHLSLEKIGWMEPGNQMVQQLSCGYLKLPEQAESNKLYPLWWFQSIPHPQKV
jgi:hypothetical protein